jgi:hypothetical protein
MDYIVIFFRRDNKPVEEYYYNSLELAQEHLALFSADDSGLYQKIQIIDFSGVVLAEIAF